MRALCRYTSRRDIGDLAALAPDCAPRSTFASATCATATSSPGSSGADDVFHLAASISVPYSFEAPREVVMTNVEGTLNVLQAVRAQASGGCCR